MFVVSSKRAKNATKIGFEMHEMHRRKEQLPALVEFERDDNEFTRRKKNES